MPSREQEERHLVEAERHIAKGEERIQHQRQRLEKLRLQGAPTEKGEKLLSTMLDSLSLMKHHRDLILDALAAS